MQKQYFTTEYKGRYSEPPLDAIRQMTSSPMNKFVSSHCSDHERIVRPYAVHDFFQKSMQRSGFSLTSLQNPPESAVGGGTSRPMTSGMRSASNSGRLSPPRPSSPSSGTHRGSLDNDHRATTAPVGPSRSIYKETYVNHFVPPEVQEESERNSLNRSNSRNVRFSLIWFVLALIDEQQMMVCLVLATASKR